VKNKFRILAGEFWVKTRRKT